MAVTARGGTMTGFDITFLAIGTAAVFYACRFNRSKNATEVRRAENVWRKADFSWLALVTLFFQVPLYTYMFFPAIKQQVISVWGFTGLVLIAVAIGVAMGRNIEWGKQHGRSAPDAGNRDIHGGIVGSE
jgi:hypothetical protein